MGLDETTALKLSKVIDAKDKLKPEVYAEKLTELGVSDDQISTMEKFFSSDMATIQKDFAGEAAVEELSSLFATLKELGVPEGCVVFDPSIMRGLDYYTGVVFEAFDVSPDNNRALFGGGRYDNLLGLFSKNSISGAGFGLGDVTLMQFLETHGLLEELPNDYDIGFACLGREAWLVCQKKSAELRQRGHRIYMPLDYETSMKSQLKTLAKLDISKVIIVGENEMASGDWTFKNMQSSEQKTIKADQIAEVIS